MESNAFAPIPRAARAPALMPALMLALMLSPVLTAPLAAQQAGDPPPEAGGPLAEEGPSAEEGLGLMEEGARLFLRGILSEMEPALEGLRDRAAELEPAVRDFAREMGPRMAELLSRVDDIRHYEAPEILPNGDIVIRRSPDAPPYEPPPEEAAPAEPIDL